MQGLVTAAATGKPLGGVQVAGNPGALSATTASDGTFSLTDLAVGTYVLTLTRDGYSTLVVPGVSAPESGATHLAVAMSTDSTSHDGLAISVQDQLFAGFDSAVALTATVLTPDTTASALTYSWTQTWGTPAAQLAGLGGPTLTFKTLALSDAKAEANASPGLGPYEAGTFVPARFGPMSVSISESGNYRFSLTVTDPEGHSATTAVTVFATPPTTGLRSVVTRVPVWLEGDGADASGAPVTAWSWQLVPPAGSTATIANPTSQFVTFTPDVAGTYDVTETLSGKTARIYANPWDGVSGVLTEPGSGNDYLVQGCKTCHFAPFQFPDDPKPGIAPDAFEGWATTKHARALADGLDGNLGPNFGPDCLQCHALGDLPTPIGNSGFSDIAASVGWTFPTTLQPGNYATLVATEPYLAQLANVQCDNCHGPRNLNVMGVDDFAAKSFTSGVCATCHSQAKQWKTSLHDNLQLAIDTVATTQAATDCARCHTAQGFAEYTRELRGGCVAAGSGSCLLTSDGAPPSDAGTNAMTSATLDLLRLNAAGAQPQTCAACHDPHDIAGNPKQLRIFDSVPTTLINGLSISGAGAGALCMVCHSSTTPYPSIGDDSLATNGMTSATPLVTPHLSSQSDVLFGANAYFLPFRQPSPHLAVADTCVGCHHDILTASERDAGTTLNGPFDPSPATNHAFATDLSICSSCHAAAFDGASIQSQTRARLDALDEAIFGKVATVLAATGAYTTSVRDPATSYSLCTTESSTPNLLLPIATTPVTFAPYAQTTEPPAHATHWRSLAQVLVTFPSNPFAGLTGLAECTDGDSPVVVAGATYGGGPVVLSLVDLQAGASRSPTGVPLFSAVSILGRAIYNEALLNADGSFGVHNRPFSDALITATMGQLALVTPTSP